LNVYVKVMGALLIALVAAVLIVPSFIDWNRYKTQITEPVEELTGRKLVIAGDVSFTVLPAPAFSANELLFANAQGGRAEHLASVESLDVRVAFLPLLGGRIQVESIALINPVIALEVLGENRTNWSFHSRDIKTPTSGAANGGKKKTPEDDTSVDIRFEEVVIENGIVTYDDATTGIFQQFSNIGATVSATSLNGPYAARGGLEYQQLPLSFEVLIGNLANSRALPISFSLALEDQMANLAFAGWASEPSLDARFNGRATIEGLDLAGTADKVMAALVSNGGSTPGNSPALQSAFSAEAQVVIGAGEGRLRNLSVQLGEDTATGGFHIAFGDHPVFEGNLDIPSVNLDRWLLSTDDAQQPNDDVEGQIKSADGPDNSADKQMSDFSLPKDLSGTFKLSVGAVTYNEGVVRQIGLALRMGDGKLGIENGSALLPGGSSIDLAGVLAIDAGQPQFTGRVNAASDNFRNLLSWLNLNIDDVPVDRLTRLSYTSSIDVSADIVQLVGIDATLDTMQVAGGVSLAVSDRLAFGLDLSIDVLDVDKYLSTHEGGVNSEESGSQPAKQVSAFVRFKKQLSELDNFDANVRLNLGRFSWAGHKVSELVVDGVLYGGEVTLTKLKVGDYLGAAGTLSGSVRGLSNKPAADLRLDFALSKADALQRIAGQALPYPLAHLGVGTGGLSVEGDESRVTVNLDTDFSGTAISVNGAIVAPMAAPVVDMTMSVINKSFARFAKHFELPFTQPNRKDDASVSWSLSALGKADDMQLQSALDVGGGKISVDGKIKDPFSELTYDFALDVKAKDLTKWIRAYGMDFQPSSDLGGVDASVSVSGNHIRAELADLKGNVGPVDFKGEAAVRMTGDRPRVTGTLETSEVVVDMFRAASAISETSAGNLGNEGTAKAGEKWSREPFDLSLLRDFDAEFGLRAPEILVGDYDFRNVTAEITVEEGVVSANPLKAHLFDGEAALNFKLYARQTPELDLRLSITNADVATAMTAAAGLQAVTGRAGFSGEFNTVGHSQLEMVAALKGGARISAREGVIRGIDLPKLSDRLHNLDNIKNVVGIVAGSLSGGETAYRSIEGAVQVAKGVVRTTDVRTDVDAVDTTVTSEMDLVKWTMDTEARFRLTDHPKAPNVGVDLRGPIDQPRRDLKTQRLESYLGKRVAAAMLNKLVGKKTAPQEGTPPATEGTPQEGETQSDGQPVLDPAPAPAPAPAAPEPEDALRELLETLP